MPIRTVSKDELAALFGVNGLNREQVEAAGGTCRDLHLTKRELAHVLDLSERTITSYMQRGLPSDKDESGHVRFDAYIAVPWCLKEHQRQRTSGSLRR